MPTEMPTARKQAYAFLLSAAFLHLKWDLACLWGGLDWRPWRLRQQLRSSRKAVHRSNTFHNLAIFLTLEMDGFDEDRFWRDIEQFRRLFPEDWSDYRLQFERKLSGEEVHVISPGGMAR